MERLDILLVCGELGFEYRKAGSRIHACFTASVHRYNLYQG